MSGDTIRAIDAWLDQTYRAAGRAESTIRNRRSYLRTMAAEADPLSVDVEGLLSYIASRRGLSPEARKSMIVALRSFYSWAYRRGLIANNLTDDLPRVRIPRSIPKPVPIDVLARARTIADEPTRLVLDLGALAGLRRDEIARVHADDVTAGGLRVTGKGGVQRIVPIHPRLRVRLGGLRGYAFPGRFGGHASPDWVADRVAAVMPGWTTHSLRHYFATKAYQGTHDLRAVQELLGHADVSTTQRYVLVDAEDLIEAVASVA